MRGFASTKMCTTRTVQAVQEVYLVPFRPRNPLLLLTQEHWTALDGTRTDEAGLTFMMR